MLDVYAMLAIAVLLVICRNAPLDRILWMDMVTRLVATVQDVDSVITKMEPALAFRDFTAQDANIKLLSTKNSSRYGWCLMNF